MFVSAEKAVLALLAVLVLALFYATFSAKQAQNPATQPSAPAAAPSCPGGICRPYQARPFAVTCPYCRNNLTVLDGGTGQVGTVTGATPKTASK